MKTCWVLLLTGTMLFAGKLTPTIAKWPAREPVGPLSGPGNYSPAQTVPPGDPVQAMPGSGVIHPTRLWGLNAVVDTSVVNSFDADYSQATGTMWAATAPTYDSLVRVYKSTDHGITWDNFSSLRQTPRRTYAKVMVVVGEGDSNGVCVFALDRTGNGSIWVARYDFDDVWKGSWSVGGAPDTITDFTACGDQRPDYGLFVLHVNDYRDALNAKLRRSFDFGRTWDASNWGATHQPSLAAGADSFLHAAYTSPRTSQRVYYERNKSRGLPSAWEPSVNVSYDTFEHLTPVVAVTNTQPESAATIWLMYTKNFLNEYDYDVWYAVKSPARGDTWRKGNVLSGTAALREYNPDIKKYKGADNPYVDVAYFAADTGFRWFSCIWAWSVGSDPDVFQQPTTVNDSGTSCVYSLIRPKVVYSPGAPASGGGVMYCRGHIANRALAHGVYFNAPWFLTGVAGQAGRRTAPALVVRPSVSAGPVMICPPPGARAVCVYDAGGRMVRRFATGGSSAIILWDGKDAADNRVSPGVYYVSAEVSSGRAIDRVTITR